MQRQSGYNPAMVVKRLAKPLARPLWNRIVRLTDNAWNEIADQLQQIELKVDDNSRATLDRISFHGKQLTQMQDQIDTLQDQIDRLSQRLEPGHTAD
jgi:ubiquinone biosynthesis protein UbiJ